MGVVTLYKGKKKVTVDNDPFFGQYEKYKKMGWTDSPGGAKKVETAPEPVPEPPVEEVKTEEVEVKEEVEVEVKAEAPASKPKTASKPKLKAAKKTKK